MNRYNGPLISIQLIVSQGFKFFLIGLMAVVTTISLLWNLSLIDRHMEERALFETRGIFSLIVTARDWNSGHGGMYVKVDSQTKPNPYLKDPNRDVMINQQLYTLMNPAYMTREISDLTKKNKGIVVHLTSLQPLNPDNKADQWEQKALNSFEEGYKEEYGFIDNHQEIRFRYAASLALEKSCISCHDEERYEPGKNLGAISITIPGEPLVMIASQQKQAMYNFHIIFFILFTGITLFFLKRLNQSWQAVREYEEQIKYQAYHDPLTDLPNRRMFEELIVSSIQRNKYNNNLIGVMLLDLDGFKGVNDNFGHQIGDELLKEVAQRLKWSIRENDVAARLGGDEFMVLLGPLTKQNELALIADRILENLAKPYCMDSNEILISASMGISIYPNHGKDYTILMRKADIALYQSKVEGRNRWTISSDE